MIKALLLVALFLLTVACAVPAPTSTPMPEPTPTIAPTPTPNLRPYAQLSRSLAVCVFDNQAMHRYFGEAMAVAGNPPALAGMIELAITNGETTEAEALDTLITCIETQ